VRRWLLAGAALVTALSPRLARAGEFDGLGEYHPDPKATAYVGFETDPDRYVPSDADATCLPPMFTAVVADDAIDGKGYVHLVTLPSCAERFQVTLPPIKASYRASVWMRHGALDATVFATYPAGSGLDNVQALLAPTGRTTSDGWIELATNDFSVDGALADHVYARVGTYAAVAGVDFDALEIVPSGAYLPQKDCAGLSDAACGAEEICLDNRCIPGGNSVPPLPPDGLRSEVVDVLEAKLRLFYGGRRSRDIYLPHALDAMEQMRKAKTAFQFWNWWATGVHRLHDWHTDTYGGPHAIRGSTHRLNACFFEGDADLSHAAWPKDSKYADILVSHVGPGAAGLKAGDRLVAVDGVHPLEWATRLASIDWGYHVATDPDNFADYAEALGGPYWSGGAFIQRYATNLTVIRCDAKGTCSAPETVAVTDLPDGGGGPDVACDNRPFYHLDLDPATGPDPTKHYIFGSFFRGPIVEAKPEEKILGLVWDTLYGGGDPNSQVNQSITAALADFRANAHGVILDHRAGNGGTIDTVTSFTSLVRPPGTALVTRIPIEIAGVGGPATTAEGLAEFSQFESSTGVVVGAPDWVPSLPVALILHRDGSASDYFPFAMKGAPHVRLFGPHPTAGAFSTYIQFSGGGLGFQLGSGDSIAPSGETMIGHGAVPDVILLPTQSDLLAGKDTLFEAALAWVRSEAAP
jgi:hypothetical protein